MERLCAPELYDRLRKIGRKHDDEASRSAKPPNKLGRFADSLILFIAKGIAVGIVVAFASGMAFLVVYGIYSLWLHGQPDIAERCLYTLSAIVLHYCFLIRVAPAFIPTFVRLRRAQKYLPIKQSLIARTWFERGRFVHSLGAVLMIAIVSGAWIAHAPFAIVATSVFWHALVFLSAAHLGFVAVSRCGQLGWVCTALFWFYAIIGFIGIQAIEFANTSVFAAIVTGPFFAVLYIPVWMRSVIGDWPTFGCVTGCWMLVILFLKHRLGMRIQDWLSPTPYRMLQICRCWRSLPDCEDPKLGQLSYPSAANATDVDESITKASRLIRREVGVPSPSVLIDSASWNRYRAYAFSWLLLHASVGTVLAYLQIQAGIPFRPIFAMSIVVVHAPAMLALLRGAPLIQSRVVTVGGLLRVGIKGLVRDSLTAAVVLSPFAYLVGVFGGDFLLPISHVCNCLAVAAILRVAWIPLLRLQGEVINLCYGFTATWVSFFAGGLMLVSLRAIFRIQFPDEVVIIPLLVGIAVTVVGWDRLAMVIRPHVPKFVVVWDWLNRPIFANKYRVP